MTTRRQFIINSVLAGMSFPLVTGLSLNPPTNSFHENWKDIKSEKGFYFAGIFETPIQEGEKVKDLVYEYSSKVLQKDDQLAGCTVAAFGEIFVVIDGRYCRVTGLEELA